MRKKLYMQPEIDITKIEVQRMIAASDSLGLGDPVDDAGDAEGREDLPLNLGVDLGLPIGL